MPTKPILSVIVPVYNAEKTLKASLNSVLSQNLNDIEIICVNDGSTDSSSKLLSEIAAHDERIRIISQENAGAGAARNAGIKTAQGNYVCFFDPDDLYPDKNVLADLVSGAEEHNVAICGGSMRSFRGEYPTKVKNSFAPSLWGYVFEKDEVLLYADYQFDYGFHRFIYKRELLLQNNIMFPTWKRFQDPPFLTRSMIAAEKFYALERPSYLYRGHSEPMKWTCEKTCEFLRGCTELLNISHIAHLDRLHALTMARVYENRNEQRETLPRNNKNAREVIEQLRKAAHPEILCESDFITAQQFEDSLRMRFMSSPMHRAARKVKHIIKRAANRL